MPMRTCRWQVRNPPAKAGDYDGTWIWFELDPAPGGPGGEPERRDVTAKLSRDVRIQWGLSEADVSPVLFWLAVYEGVVKEQEEVNFTWYNAPPTCPPEWKRPEPPKGVAFEVEFPARAIGF